MPRGVPGSGSGRVKAKPAAPRARGRGRGGRGRGAAASADEDPSPIISETPLDANLTAAEVFHNPEVLDAPAPAHVEAEAPGAKQSVQHDGDHEMHEAPTPAVQQSIETPELKSPPDTAAPQAATSSWTAVNTDPSANSPTRPMTQSSSEQAGSSSTATGTSTSAAAPLPRVSALKAAGTGTPARSVSPMVSGASRARKGLAYQPFYKGRRNKEERDARQAEVLAKERQRKAAQEAEESAAASAALRRAGWMSRGGSDRGRGRGRGRGGFMGDQGRPLGVAGPFSAGVAVDNKKYVQRSRIDPRVKREGDGQHTGARKTPEDGGYISSDPDDVVEGPRFNVDAINNIESSDEDSRPNTSSSIRARKPRPMSNLAPVRLARSEHKDRVMGINTEASSKTAAELRKQKEVKGEASTEGIIASVSRKAKGKVQDIEIMGSRKFKGVWHDEEDDLPPPQVKQEPGTAEEDPLVVQSGSTAPQQSDDTTIKSPPASPTSKRKAKARALHPRRTTQKPVIQTEEERQEWMRHEVDLQTLRDELGHIEENPEATTDQKADRVYLFQLPPIVPSLHPAVPKVKFEEPPTAPDTEPPTEAVLETKASSSKTTRKDTSKKDPGSSSTNLVNIDDAPPKKEVDPPPEFASGRAGKLRVHKSGRATLSWGGTAFELQMGMSADFLEDVVVMKMEKPKPKPGEEQEFGGEALGFGQVRGKFVVSPDWGEIVG